MSECVSDAPPQKCPSQNLSTKRYGGDQDSLMQEVDPRLGIRDTILNGDNKNSLTYAVI